MLNYWATWCQPCREEMPALERLWQLRKGQGLVIVGIASGEQLKEVQRFVERLARKPTFRIVLDKDLSVTRSSNVRGLPTTLILDRDGKPILFGAGKIDFDSEEILFLVDKLLATGRR